MVMTGILFMAILAFTFVTTSNGINCWVCHQAQSNRECIIRGYARRCGSNEGCENEVRYNGHSVSITKRCKQLRACSNDQLQNTMKVNNMFQCGTDNPNSVCKCCCKTNHCNKDQLTCLENGQPKCRFLFLPNGFTKCSGSNDGTSLRTRCTFHCRSGFERYGAYAATCQRRGVMAEWSSHVPACKKKPTCMRLYEHSITNGYVRCSGMYSLATLGTACVFRCNPRYFMVNENKRKRFSNYERTVCTLEKSSMTPTWTKKPPNCIEQTCRVILRIRHGIVKCTELNRVGSVCGFECYPGYQKIGPDKIICEQGINGKNWNDQIPVCHPKPCPGKPSNSPLLVEECTESYQFGSLCSFKCKAGFYLAKPDKDGAVEFYATRCILNNEELVWSHKSPRCIPKKCLTMRDPKHGEVKCSHGDKYLSRCSFVCTSPVHEISGQKDIQCVDDGIPGKQNGVWNNEPPICVLKKCPVINPGATKVKCNNGFVYGSSCKFSCRPEYFMVASDGITIMKSKADTITKCVLKNGNVVWTNSPPQCETKHCPELTMLESGDLFCTKSNEYGSKCAFDCDPGYEIKGSSNSRCEEVSPDKVLGNWNYPQPTCIKRTCSQLYAEEMTSELKCSDDNRYQSACTVTCKNGYYMRRLDDNLIMDRSKTACDVQDDSMIWTTRVPSCQPKICDALRAMNNGTMQCSEELIYNARCDFKCSAGFNLEGESSVSCVDDGSVSSKGIWNENVPVCAPRKCPSLEYVKSTTQVLCDRGNDYTSHCEITCKRKHFMRNWQTGEITGGASTQCVLNDNDEVIWTTKPPNCEPVTCPQIKIGGGLYVTCSNSNKTNSRCVFSCPIGYDLVGNITNKCMEIGANDANWKHPIPFCQIRSCLELVSEENMNMTCSDESNYLSKCSFGCATGRGLFMIDGGRGNSIIPSGVSTLQCDIDDRGSMYWTGSLPSCVVKYCLVMRDLKNGSVKCTKGSKYNSKCTFACKRGYKRVGSTSIKCTEGKQNSPAGKWNNKPPVCTRR